MCMEKRNVTDRNYRHVLVLSMTVNNAFIIRTISLKTIPPQKRISGQFA